MSWSRWGSPPNPSRSSYRRSRWLGWLALAGTIAAAADCGYPTFIFQAGTGGAGTGGGGTGGGPALTCAAVHDAEGCCDKHGVLHFCDKGSLIAQTCGEGQVCGFDDLLGYYDCVPPPGGPDPSGINPMACGP